MTVWQSFSHDPRLREHASLRASDADRDVVREVLTEAYADGRLDREEFDARTDRVGAARLLGELPPIVAGLVPVDHTVTAGLLTEPQVRERAVAAWRSERREALWGFVSASLVCWVIWAAVMLGDFPWPLFVMLGTGINVLRIQFQRSEIVDQKRRSIEKSQRKALEKRRREGGPS